MGLDVKEIHETKMPETFEIREKEGHTPSRGTRIIIGKG